MLLPAGRLGRGLGADLEVRQRLGLEDIASIQSVRSKVTSVGLLLAFRGASGVAASGMRRLMIVWHSKSLVTMTGGDV